MASVEAAGQKCPAAHGPEQLDVDKPVTAPYNPSGHGPVHSAEDTATLAPKRPSGQFVHTAAVAKLYCPAWHVWAVGLVEPAGQK